MDFLILRPLSPKTGQHFFEGGVGVGGGLVGGGGSKVFAEKAPSNGRHICVAFTLGRMVTHPAADFLVVATPVAGAGDFVLGIRQGEIFLFDPMCLYSKYSELLWRIQKWLKSTKKDFDPDPASGSDLG